jgi:hypothetical protein
MILHHVTLATGHTTTHRLDTLDPAAIAACRALLPSGGPVPALPAYRVQITGPLFTLWRGREPIVACAHGHGQQDAATWQTLADLQAEAGAPVKATRPPANGRWLAVAVLPGIAHLTRADIAWLADFERCLTAAMIQAQASAE